MNIVLIGYRCAGKSNVGRELALRLQREFVDTDRLAEERQQSSISEIVKFLGWEHFRNLEKNIIKEVTERNDLVIAAGGGAILDPENVTALKNKGIMIWLKADRQALHARMLRDPRTLVQRPPLTGIGSLEEIDEVMACRIPFYEKAMDLQLDTSKTSVKAVVESLLSMLQEKRVI